MISFKDSSSPKARRTPRQVITIVMMSRSSSHNSIIRTANVFLLHSAYHTPYEIPSRHACLRHEVEFGCTMQSINKGKSWRKRGAKFAEVDLRCVPTMKPISSNNHFPFPLHHVPKVMSIKQATCTPKRITRQFLARRIMAQSSHPSSRLL